MRQEIKKYWEVALIKLASKILRGRNVHRSAVVSRRDNNNMWGMSEELDGICTRMLDEYENI